MDNTEDRDKTDNRLSRRDALKRVAGIGLGGVVAAIGSLVTTSCLPYSNYSDYYVTYTNYYVVYTNYYY